MFFLQKNFDGKSVMSMFCNVIMLLLLYVHVCVTRTGWKTRPWPKTVILSIKKSINQSINPSLLPLSLMVSFSLFLGNSTNSTQKEFLTNNYKQLHNDAGLHAYMNT